MDLTKESPEKESEKDQELAPRAGWHKETLHNRECIHEK